MLLDATLTGRVIVLYLDYVGKRMKLPAILFVDAKYWHEKSLRGEIITLLGWCTGNFVEEIVQRELANGMNIIRKG